MLNFPQGEHDVHDEIVEMAISGELTLGDFYSHVVPADEIQKAVDMVKSREAFKIVVSFC